MSGPMEFVVPQAKLASLQVDLKRLVQAAPVMAARGVSVDAEALKGEGQAAGLNRVRLISEGAPKLGGFELVGRIEHLGDKGNRVRRLSVVDLDPRFFAADPICEHCGKMRNRRETFLLRDAAGVVRQVGRSCFKEYAAGSSESDIVLALARAELVAALAERIEAASSGQGEGVHLGTFLAVVAEVSMEHGWVSATKAKESGVVATAERAQHAWHEGQIGRVRPAAGSLASAALKWVRGLTPQEDEYLEKVRSVCARDIVTPPELALAASAIWAYSERGRFAKRAAKSEKGGTSKVLALGPVAPEATLPTVSEQEWLKLAGAAQAEVERLMILMRSDGPLDQDAAAAVAEAAMGPLAALAAAMTPVGAKR